MFHSHKSGSVLSFYVNRYILAVENYLQIKSTKYAIPFQEL